VGLNTPKLASIEKTIRYSYLVGMPTRVGRMGFEVLFSFISSEFCVIHSLCIIKQRTRHSNRRFIWNFSIWI